MSFLNKAAGRALAAVALAVILVAAVFFVVRQGSSPDDQGISGAGVPFEAVDGAHRELDGSPALALSFSLPLDARDDHGKFLQVLEMPASGAPQAAPHRHDDEDEDESSSAADVTPVPLTDGEKADLLKIASRGDI